MEPTYFWLQLREKSTDFNAVFSVRINDERYMRWYELAHLTWLMFLHYLVEVETVKM